MESRNEDSALEMHLVVAMLTSPMQNGQFELVRKLSQDGGGGMARWPRQTWTTVLTYGAVFVLFPLLAFLAYAYVQGWWFW